MRTRSRNSQVRQLAFVLVALLVGGTAETIAVAEQHLEHKGRAVPHRTGARSVAPRRSPRVETYRIGHNAAEPTIGVSQKGTVFYTAADFEIDGNDVMRSVDSGRSWQLVTPMIGPRRAHAITRDPYLYVDEDTSRIFNIDLTLACSYVSSSDDAGGSWITNPLGCGIPVNDHQTLFSGPPVTSPTVGYPNIVYYCYNQLVSSSCTKSLDGGLTFTATGAPAFTGVDPHRPEAGFCGGLSGHGRVGPDGTVYLPKGWCGIPWVAISHDEGRTWTRVRVAKKGSADPHNSIAVDRKGNVYYLWIADDLLPYLSISRNEGRTWSKPVMVAAPGVVEASLPTIDAAGPGKIAIAYMGTENVKGRLGNRDHTYSTWNGYLAVAGNALTSDPLIYTATVNDRHDPLIRGSCGPDRCGNVWDFIDVEIGPRGETYGSFVDACIGRCGRTGPPNEGAEGLIARIRGGPRLR